MDPNRIHKLDQGAKDMSETLSTLAWSYYQSLTRAGFTSVQSFTLVRDYLTVFTDNFLRTLASNSKDED